MRPPTARRNLIAVVDGYRESEQSWYELLVDLKGRGLSLAPKLAIGDGALGFWAALRKVYGETREQRCWLHKTANVLNNMPKSVQPRAKTDIHEIWMADTRQHATKAFDAFLEKYQAKYPVACECLAKDRDVLLAFYDFPAEHWKHLRTTNPIESTFATIRLRQRRTKGCGTQAGQPDHDVQARSGSTEKVATTQRSPTHHASLGRKEVRQRSPAGRRLKISEHNYRQ